MLDLRLSALTGRAVLACDEGSVRVLQVLRGRYVSSSSITNQAFELDVEDLLVNLRELAIWPSDDADSDSIIDTALKFRAKLDITCESSR